MGCDVRHGTSCKAGFVEIGVIGPPPSHAKALYHGNFDSPFLLSPRATTKLEPPIMCILLMRIGNAFNRWTR
jgi:hypothetical protein